MEKKQLVELLAEYAHTQWSGWMKYLFEKCETNINNDVVIPQWAVQRWKRQIETNYKDLSESEKESDRKEAIGMLEVIEKNVQLKL